MTLGFIKYCCICWALAWGILLAPRDNMQWQQERIKVYKVCAIHKDMRRNAKSVEYSNYDYNKVKIYNFDFLFKRANIQKHIRLHKHTRTPTPFSCFPKHIHIRMCIRENFRKHNIIISKDMPKNVCVCIFICV